LVDAIADLHRADFVLGEGISNQTQKNGLSASLIFPRVRRGHQKDEQKDEQKDGLPPRNDMSLSTAKAAE